MKKFKKFLALSLSTVMAAGLLTACGSGKTGETKGADAGKANTTEEGKTAKAGEGQVYYLNFKPEVADVWNKIAEAYTKESGVPVKVETAAAGTYEQTLKSEISKKDAPTLFQINGPVGYQSWKDYTLDLKDTDLYSWLIDKDMAVKDGDGIYGIPYVVEGYGIIYNQEIMDKYFALADKAVDISSTSEINNFKTLKAVAEDMTAKKAELGIEGAFASTSFSPGEDWRWQTHLANIPIYYEYKDNNVVDEKEVSFKYNENFKNILDLYLNNSITDPKMVGSKSVEDSMSEFALGKVAMVQNGNWGWSQVSGVDGNIVKEENVKFLPIYTGIEGEEKQGLAIGTENFFSINSKASEADQKASIAFVEWLMNSETGKSFITNDLGFISPFNTFTDAEKPQDPLAQEVIRYMNNSDLYSVPWYFASFPSQQFKDNFGGSLLEYAQGKKEWDKVVSDMVADWKVEKEATATEK